MGRTESAAKRQGKKGQKGGVGVGVFLFLERLRFTEN